MRIGELADVSGVPSKTIRYYEQAGLIPEPPRTSSGSARPARRACLAPARYSDDAQTSSPGKMRSKSNT
ncbi:hypothetical protein SMICM304S_00347 [Streptomyces microflavus]